MQLHSPPEPGIILHEVSKRKFYWMPLPCQGQEFADDNDQSGDGLKLRCTKRTSSCRFASFLIVLACIHPCVLPTLFMFC